MRCRRLAGCIAATLGSVCLVAPLCGYSRPVVDPLERAEHSVVRVVTVNLDQDDNVVAVGTGSGFAVAPGRVVTNNHVVEPVPGAFSVRVFVVPERDSGGHALRASISRDWPAADLALVDAPSLAAPPLTVALPVPEKDATVHALGYPGATDEMRRLEARDILRPAEPYVTPGSIALLSPTAVGGGPFDTIFHTAAVSPGSSGGPLIDACGRVVGVNAWRATGAVNPDGSVSVPEGQSAAVRSNVLAQFLARDGLAVDQTACVPPLDAVEARLSAAEAAIASEAKLRAAVQSELAKRDAEILAAASVAAAIALAAGIRFLLMRRKSAARPLADTAHVAGQTFERALVAIVPAQASSRPFVMRRGLVTGIAASAAAAVAAVLALRLLPAPGAANLTTNAATQLSCAVDSNQSFGLPRGAGPTSLTFDPTSDCVNGRTPYQHTATGFRRVIVADRTRTISVLELAGNLETLRLRDYVLAPDDYLTVRTAAQVSSASRCDALGLKRVSQLGNFVMPYIFGQPLSQVTWRCSEMALPDPAGGLASASRSPSYASRAGGLPDRERPGARLNEGG